MSGSSPVHECAARLRVTNDELALSGRQLGHRPTPPTRPARWRSTPSVAATDFDSWCPAAPVSIANHPARASSTLAQTNRWPAPPPRVSTSGEAAGSKWGDGCWVAAPLAKSKRVETLLSVLAHMLIPAKSGLDGLVLRHGRLRRPPPAKRTRRAQGPSYLPNATPGLNQTSPAYWVIPTTAFEKAKRPVGALASATRAWK